jgi:hypothetical protein
VFRPGFGGQACTKKCVSEESAHFECL